MSGVAQYVDQTAGSPGTSITASNLNALAPAQSYLISGGIPAVPGSGLSLTQPATVVVINAPGVAALSVAPAATTVPLQSGPGTAQDQFVDLWADGTYHVSTVASGATPPALTNGGNAIRLYKVRTNGSNTACVSVSQLVANSGVFQGMMDARVWFGFKGDGTSDDTAAYARMVTFLNGVGGGHVYLGPGTFPISAFPAITASNVTISGAGASTILQLKASSNANMMALTGAQSCLIRDLTVDQNVANNGSLTTSNTVLSADAACHNLTVERVSVINTNGFAIFCAGGATSRMKNARVLNCTVTLAVGGLDRDGINFLSEGGLCWGNTVYPQAGLGINIYESNYASCALNTIVLAGLAGAGIAISSCLGVTCANNQVKAGASDTAYKIVREQDNTNGRDCIDTVFTGNTMKGASNSGFLTVDAGGSRGASYAGNVQNTVIAHNVADTGQFFIQTIGTNGATISTGRVSGNILKTITSPRVNTLAPTGWVHDGNPGYNPVGAISGAALSASPQTVVNTSGVNASITMSTSQGGQVAVDGVVSLAPTVISIITVPFPAGSSAVFTWSSTPPTYTIYGL